MRRGNILALVGIGMVAGGLAAAVALLLPWFPDVASKERERIDFVFWFTIWICVVIFALVAAVLTYSVWRFRAAPDDDSDGPPIHGHTGLEIVWTLIPTALVTSIGIVSAIVLSQNAALGKNVLHVNVTAQQFAWSFSYPEAKNLTSGTLRLPIHRSVLLTLHAKDVIHSFWVPEFGQKQDVVPGIVTTLVITPTKLGDFRVICTELCGLGHALMRTRAIVLSPEGFNAWIKKQREAAGGPPGQAGEAAFKSLGCVACHTLTAAGATGKVGPDLDNLDKESIPGGQSLEAYVRQSIQDPSAYRRPGYAAQMPPFDLPKAQLDALVAFVVESAKQH